MTELNENEIPEISELDHLIKLLDDEDENIYSNVRERFISHGKDTSDYLENFLSNILKDENLLIKKRANEIITTINFENIEFEMSQLLDNGSKNLLEDAMLLIASYGYPLVDKSDYRRKLDKFSFDIRAKLNEINNEIEEIPPMEILKTINNYFFKEIGFTGNNDNYYDPDNSFLNKVIDRKIGIPITLSIVYMLVAKRLDLPVYGLSLPGHFILKYNNGNPEEEYFVDPFNKGVLISVQEASQFIKNSGISKEEFIDIPYLKPSSEKEILLRVLRNLVEAFKKENESLKSEQLEKLMQNFA